MSYTKNTWKSGDTVTSAKLNNMEEGIASSGAFIVHGIISGDTITLDKTWKEIYDAVQEKYVGIVYSPSQTVVTIMPVLGISNMDSAFIVHTIDFNAGTPMPFTTDSEDGYPTLAEDNTNQGGFVIDNPNLGQM